MAQVTVRGIGAALMFVSVACSAATVDQSAAAAEPIKVIVFDEYADTAELLADCETWQCSRDSDDDANRSKALDTAVAHPGYRRSMRYDYLHPGDGCNSLTVTRAFELEEPLQQVWLEIPVRWSSNFRTTNDACSPNDHKLIFGLTDQPNTFRWELKVGSDGGPRHSVVVRAAGTNAGENDERRVSGISASELWDGEWHIIRLYFRHSTRGNGRDGAMRLWIDGELAYEESGIQTATDGNEQDFIAGIALGRNKDDGPAGERMSMWWGYVKVWDEDPRF